MENQKETVSEPISSELLKELLYVYFFEKGEDGREDGYEIFRLWLLQLSDHVINRGEIFYEINQNLKEEEGVKINR